MKPLFKEKQYLGRNKHTLAIRLILAVFCFVAYFWSRNREMEGELFLIVGFVILALSLLLVFIPHFQTKVYAESIELESLRTIRKIKIPIKNLKEAKVIDYNRFYINNPVFNLHLKGNIHFYTYGNKAVQLTDKEGLVYVIGTQEPERLAEVIKESALLK